MKVGDLESYGDQIPCEKKHSETFRENKKQFELQLPK